MGSLAFRTEARATGARCTGDELIVMLVDGRSLSVPLAWFPRLAGATPEQREACELLGDGEGLHWPGVDEDISVAGLLAGRGAVEYESGRSSEPGA